MQMANETKNSSEHFMPIPLEKGRSNDSVYMKESAIARNF